MIVFTIRRYNAINNNTSHNLEEHNVGEGSLLYIKIRDEIASISLS